MKFLEFKDENNETKLMSLEGYKSVTFPLCGDIKQEATLYTHDNMVATIKGTDFKIIE
ncbi:hypothetical protein HED34_03215 [Vagococcus fluvialis]|uniref:hypothetical protein n=1 Tax=Vagococcus fluvialis TaxID=2738 RepID=UPI0014331785|nr:hypothetical protein [Vagococcus fluvialis]NKC58970.1 hypothetical protein [Vagococcus fluvialis]NKD49725.1 hypothetical protein [Vagococcus fluvialis]